MKKFVHENWMISILLGLAVFIILSYLITSNMPELLPGVDKWFNLLFQLAIGYSINFIFFVIQVYLPSEKRIAPIKICIRERLERIESNMRCPFDALCALYLPKCKDNYEDDELHLVTTSIQLTDLVNAKNIANGQPISVKEWITKYILETENEIDRLYRHYATYISPELMTILEKIQNSSYQREMKQFCDANCSVNFSKLSKGDDYLINYYHMLQELNTYHIDNF